MKKIALATALLVAAGSAFAGSDHFGSGHDLNSPVVDNSYTASMSPSTTATVDEPDVRATNKIQPQFEH
ncbi:DUF680 domain-containing protein [Mesorhizobium sp. A556]